MNRKIIIGALGCLLFVGLVLWFLDSPSQSELAQRKLSAAWTPEYEILSDDPRGLGFFNQLLEEHVTDSVYIAERSTQLDSIPGADSATFLFIGNDFAVTYEELDTLLRLIDSGATLFMSFDQLSSNVYERFFEENAFYWEYSNRTFVAIEDTSLAYYSVFQNDTIHDDWYTFNPNAIKDTLYKAFAFSMYKPVAFELKRGKGKVILHSMPRLFMNYQVIEPNGFTHTSYVLRKIPENNPVIWLEFGRWDQQMANRSNNSDDKGNGNEKADNSYLQYIMADESLRWAFMLAIFVFILYALFRAKRREAVLPGVPEKRNMSLAFVETLSSIYLSRNSPYGILQVLRKNFYMAVSRHFYIDLLNTQKREEDIKRLLEKSSVDEEDLREMLNFLETKPENQRFVNEVTLGRVYRSIRKFYIQTGISRGSDHFVIGKSQVVLHPSLLIGCLGLLVGLLILFRGMYGLASGGGYGILIVIASLFFLYSAIRMLSTPVATITSASFTLHSLYKRRKVLDLNQGITYKRTPFETTLYTEDGKQLTIQHIRLSRSGKNALNLFLEHIKQQSA